MDSLMGKPAMVLGLGVDLIEIERIKQALEAKSGKRFESRVFTEGEIAYCRSKADPYSHFAARFAAKEAVMKAFGTGWTARVSWKGIEVRNNELGQPFIAFHGKTEKLAGEIGVETCQISISHNRSQAVAVALLLGKTD
jgi:holo-[acyl-carrier protein] synthase